MIADVRHLSDFYKKRKFVNIRNKNLPFNKKESDFVIASHVLEHVDDFSFFIKEFKKISNKGYIELPTKLGDNLVFENETDHIWWCLYDDISNEIVLSKKNQLLEPFLSVSTAKLMEQYFRESLVIELIWDEKISYKIDDKIRLENYKKITFFKLVKKYLSKKIKVDLIFLM